MTVKSPYRGFTRLNDRRCELIMKRHSLGLSKAQSRELVMLTACIDAMLWYSCKDDVRDYAGVQQALKELRTIGRLEI